MALAIDTSGVTRKVEFVNRYYSRRTINDTIETPNHIYRACIVGTVIHDDSFFSRIRPSDDRPVARQEALDWRPNPDDELDEVEVLHHLHKQAKSSPLLESELSHTNGSTATSTVMASCAFTPSLLPASAQGRPLSAFHRCSIRYSGLVKIRPGYKISASNSISIGDYVFHRHLMLDIFLQRNIFLFSLGLVNRSDACVAWQIQFDGVDVTTRRRHPTGYPHGGRRSTINPFHRVSAQRIQEDPPSNPRKEIKQMRGVRYRDDHKRWTAEMKPPKHKNKVYFGEFESQSQAARVVDVAYHYYGKLLNFLDTPHILEERPIPANMSDEDKLNFVKEQAKWVSSIYSDLPSPPLSNGEDDGEGDDGSCQLQLLPHLEAMACLGNNGWGEGSVGIGGFGGGASTSILEAQQGLSEWRPSDLPSYTPTSSMCIIDGEDGTEHSTAPTSTNLRSPSVPSCFSYVQPDDEEVMSGRGNAKRLRSTISSHQFSPPSDQVDAAAESPLRAFAAATPVFLATFSQCPGDGDADRGDNGMCEPQPWSPVADSMETDGVLADGVDGGAVTGTLQEQQDLSVRHVENVFCSSLSSPGSFLDITGRTHSVDVAPINYGIPSQEKPIDILMMSPAPSPIIPFDSLPNHAECLWEQQSYNLDWISSYL